MVRVSIILYALNWYYIKVGFVRFSNLYIRWNIRRAHFTKASLPYLIWFAGWSTWIQNVLGIEVDQIYWHAYHQWLITPTLPMHEVGILLLSTIVCLWLWKHEVVNIESFVALPNKVSMFCVAPNIPWLVLESFTHDTKKT